jgi:hypothetical protein
MRNALIAVALAAAIFAPAPASADLLGGLLKDTTKVVKDVVKVTGDTVKTDVPKVVTNTLSTSNNSVGNDTQVLGGGGTKIQTGNLGGLLGPNGGVSVELPDANSLLTGVLPGDPGDPGNPGGDPLDPNVIFGNGSGGGGGSFTMPSGISAQLRMLIEILKNKAWVNYAEGNKVCLPAFGRAEIKGWIPKKDWDELAEIIPVFKNDILTLQKMMANCRSAIQKQALAGKGNRVVGVGVSAEGLPVVYFL